MTAAAILCVIAAQWVDNQFGFVQAMTQTPWWILLGVLVALSRAPRSADSPAALPEAEARAWYGAALSGGLFLIAALGDPIQSRSLSQPLGEWEAFVLLGALWIGLLIGVLNNLAWPRDRRQMLQIMLGVPAGWLAFFAAKWLLTQWSGRSLDSLLDGSTPLSPAAMLSVAPPLAVIGVLAVLGGLIGWVGIAPLRRLKPVQIALIGLLIGLGSYAYARNFSVTTAHHLAGAFTAQNTPAGYALADAAFDAASQLDPPNVRLRVDWLFSLLTRMQAPPARASIQPRVDEQAAQVLNYAPFYVGSRTWQAFRTQYNAILAGK